jgi:hypothetical protein
MTVIRARLFRHYPRHGTPVYRIGSDDVLRSLLKVSFIPP